MAECGAGAAAAVVAAGKMPGAGLQGVGGRSKVAVLAHVAGGAGDAVIWGQLG